MIVLAAPYSSLQVFYPDLQNTTFICFDYRQAMTTFVYRLTIPGDPLQTAGDQTPDRMGLLNRKAGMQNIIDL